MDYKQGKKIEVWLVEEKASKCVFIDHLLKKIILYPFAQLAALNFPIIYRVGNKAGSSDKWAKIAAIGNSSTAVLYTLIFFYFNQMELDKEKKEKSITSKKTSKELDKINNE